MGRALPFAALLGLAACTTESVELTEPPVAFAGFDAIVAVGAEVPLDGSLSADPDGDALSYRWRLESEPEGSTSAIAGATERVTAFTPDREGTYVVSLTVSDGSFEHRDLAGFTARAAVTSTVALELDLSPRVCNADLRALSASPCGTADGRIAIAPALPPGANAAALTGISIEWSFLRTPAGVDSAELDAQTASGAFGAFTFAPSRPGEYWISARLRAPGGSSPPVLASVGVFASGPAIEDRPLASIRAAERAGNLDRILFDSRDSIVPTSSVAEPETRRWSLALDPSHGLDALIDLATGCPTDQCRVLFPSTTGLYIVTLELARGGVQSATAIHAVEVAP